MKLIKFVSDRNIPEDGSKEILEKLEKNIKDSETEIFIYPDVHYKKGSRVVNGMLIKSHDKIYPACLGVENCGFTVGKIKSDFSTETLQDSFEKYSSEYKKRDYFKYRSKIKEIFKEYLERDFYKKRVFYDFIGCVEFSSLWCHAQKLLSSKNLFTRACGIGNMGGGNHFFELHEVQESFDDNIKTGSKLFILHSDSIGFGDAINLFYSNLSDLDYLPSPRRFIRKTAFYIRQVLFFLTNRCFFKNPIETAKLLFSQNDYRTIDCNTHLGKCLLIDHNIASVFGDMNRDYIIKEWAESSGIEYESLFSHPHDNVIVDKIGREYNVFQRNGVQFVGDDPYYMLPGALGTKSYILKNPKNEKAFFSANHGVGRLKDKHIARNCFTESDTVEKLQKNCIKLYRLGDGNIAEQNCMAFKDVDEIISEMERNGIGIKAAVTKPFAILKG